MPTWLIVILAIAAGVGIGVAAKKKDDPKFKPLAVVCVLVLLACAWFHIDNQVGIFGDNLETRNQRESAERFNEARVKKMCEYIKSKNPGKIVIIPSGGSDYAKNEYSKKQAELVKKYIGDAEIKPVEYTRTEEEAAAGPMGPTAEEWNKFFKANADANLFVVLEQLPMDEIGIYKMEIFRGKSKQKLALFDLGDVKMMKPFFESEVILVSVTGKAGLKSEDYEKLAPKDLEEAFKARYELVTKDNIKNIK